MDKVVILGRVSTDHQDYQRQVNELQDYCGKVVNGNQKCSDFGNSECSIFGIKTTVLLASAVQ